MTAVTELPVVYDLTAYRGDTWIRDFRFNDGPGTPHDLTGSTVAAWAHNTRRTITLDVVVDAPNGMVTLNLPADSLADGYAYDIEVTDPVGQVTTWVTGRLVVEQDVTNAA